MANRFTFNCGGDFATLTAEAVILHAGTDRAEPAVAVRITGVQATQKKLDAVRRGEWWPLNGSERRAMARSLAVGGYKVARGRSAGREEQRMDATGNSAEIRLNAELTALHGERQRLLTEAARDKAAKKSSGWF
ncbi:hypothetical protein [Streptomyces violaceoruber]|uniref:Uncharacterized protein n=1 Tax=Streptomyces violaceoruber TaxID=1935 RepID=A0ACD4WP19_STRVN|nr:hypothetical protein R2E43_18165 [Streptomyces violaceoruber]BDD73568.1 hypothetical protein JCM4020_41880 [Streptomyces coelicolor]